MTYPLTIALENINNTALLAKALAFGIKKTKTKALLLYGELGLGKTTLASFFTKNFAGGEFAETASPSFTLCNIYSTSPEIHHYDLYRLAPGVIDDGLAESFEAKDTVCVVEWADRLKKDDLPENALCCTLLINEQGSRYANIYPVGSEGVKAVDEVATCYKKMSNL